MDKKKILIVEDEQLMLDALKDKLTSDGFIIAEAHNGEEGLVTAFREHPDLILLDLIMPKMDGISMIKNLRSDQWGGKVPVIILTNLTPDNNVIKIIEENSPAFYLIKSDWNINDIVSKIRDLLERS